MDVQNRVVDSEMKGHSFEEFARNVMDELLSWNPLLATQLGWHKYDGKLPDPSEKHKQIKIARLRELLELLNEFADSDLSADENIDRDLAAYLFRNMLFELEALALDRRQFTAYDVIGQALFFLLFREHPSIESRLRSAISRLEAIPEYLMECKKNLKTPYRSWIEANLEVGRSLESYIDTIPDYARARAEDGELIARMADSASRARSEIHQCNRWLEEEVLPKANESYAILPEEYHEYLLLKGYGVTPEEALEIGMEFLDYSRQLMKSLAKAISGSGRIEDALSAMRSDHPMNGKQVLEEYRESSRLARQVLVAKDLVTLPQGERLLVIDTPVFMRPHTPFAAQYEPGRFDPDMTGLFLVTVVSHRPELLREHNRATIRNTAVHEGYPGHHLQAICSNTVSSSIRALISSPDFVEGWALYSEEMMIEQGFNDTPLGRLTVLNDLRYRVARLVADIRLAKGGFTIHEAAELLARECGTDLSVAEIEARSCAMSPTYFSSYFLGKLALRQLLDEVKEAMGERFSLKFFHDTLLYAGSMPMSLMRRAMSNRLKEAYGVELGGPRESLHGYAMRMMGMRD
jgi:uncharacterized protein (DUF885 family)